MATVTVVITKIAVMVRTATAKVKVCATGISSGVVLAIGIVAVVAVLETVTSIVRVSVKRVAP